jgi:hypothetical protein
MRRIILLLVGQCNPACVEGQVVCTVQLSLSAATMQGAMEGAIAETGRDGTNQSVGNLFSSGRQLSILHPESQAENAPVLTGARNHQVTRLSKTSGLIHLLGQSSAGPCGDFDCNFILKGGLSPRCQEIIKPVSIRMSRARMIGVRLHGEPNL